MPSQSKITALSGKAVKKAATVPLNQAAQEAPSALDQGVVLPTPDMNHATKQPFPTSYRLRPEEVTLFVPGRYINPVLIEDEAGS